MIVFYAENYELDANDRTDRIILPGSRAGLPQPGDPVSINLRRGNFFVLSSDLILADGAMPLLLSSGFLRNVGFLGFANFFVTYQLTQGSMPHFGHSRSTPPSLPSRVAQWKSTVGILKKCLACKTSPLCKDHAAGPCPACEALQP